MRQRPGINAFRSGVDHRGRAASTTHEAVVLAGHAWRSTLTRRTFTER
jgi:hypothetical protein